MRGQGSTNDPCSGFVRGCSALFLRRRGTIVLRGRRERAKRATRQRWRCRASIAWHVGVGLPQPLSPSDAPDSANIPLQDSGSVADAARETGRLGNDLLLGALLADRYLRGRRPPQPNSPAGLPVRRPAGGPGGPHLLELLAPGATAAVADPLPSTRRLSARTGRGRRRCDDCSWRTAMRRRSGAPLKLARSTPRACLLGGSPRCGLTRPTRDLCFSTPPGARHRPRRSRRRRLLGRARGTAPAGSWPVRYLDASRRTGRRHILRTDRPRAWARGRLPAERNNRQRRCRRVVARAGRRAFARSGGRGPLAEAELRALWAVLRGMASSIAHWPWSRARSASVSSRRDRTARRGAARGRALTRLRPAGVSWSTRRWSMRWCATNRFSIRRGFAFRRTRSYAVMHRAGGGRRAS